MAREQCEGLDVFPEVIGLGQTMVYVQVPTSVLTSDMYKNQDSIGRSIIKQILLECRQWDRPIEVAGHPIILRKGQFITSVKYFMDETGATEHKVRSMFDKLESEYRFISKRLAGKNTKKKTIISVNNYAALFPPKEKNLEEKHEEFPEETTERPRRDLDIREVKDVEETKKQQPSRGGVQAQKSGDPVVVASLPIIQELIKIGFDHVTACKVAEEASMDVIVRQVGWWPHRDKRKLENPLGALRTAIRQDWRAPEMVEGQPLGDEQAWMRMAASLGVDEEHPWGRSRAEVQESGVPGVLCDMDLDSGAVLGYVDSITRAPITTAEYEARRARSGEKATG